MLDGTLQLAIGIFHPHLPVMLITRKAGQQSYLAELITDILRSLYPAELLQLAE